MSKRLLSLFTVVMMLSVFSSAQAQAGIIVEQPVVRVPTTQIIMRDGGVCDPIRHMGC
jgi:hypothetical protein